MNVQFLYFHKSKITFGMEGTKLHNLGNVRAMINIGKSKGISNKINIFNNIYVFILFIYRKFISCRKF